MNRLDSAGCSCSFSNLSQLDESYTSTDDWQEDVGTTLDLELPDGRLNPVVSRVMVTVSPLDLRDNFTVRLATNHYSFTLGRSVTIRAFTAFLYLEVRLDTHSLLSSNQGDFISGLPQRPESLRCPALVT